MEDRYAKRNSKFVDGLLGFSGALIGMPILGFISYLITAIPAVIVAGIPSSQLNTNTQNFLNTTIGILSLLLGLLIMALNIFSIVFFFKKQRRFISIGIIVADALLIITPLLLVGACIGIIAIFAQNQ